MMMVESIARLASPDEEVWAVGSVAMAPGLQWRGRARVMAQLCFCPSLTQKVVIVSLTQKVVIVS
jgi:hypothetical protein